MSLNVLIHVTHLLGVGHLARAAAIARALAAAGHRVVLASGGMPAPLVRTGGAQLLQLPPVRSDGIDFSTLLDKTGAPAGPGLFAARERALASAIESLQPDVVLTELYPFGRRMLRAEIEAMIDLALALPRPPLVLSSVRDILVSPEDPAKIARCSAALGRFDAVLVHSDPRVVPLEASWPVDAVVRSRLRYTGYVDEAQDVSPLAALPDGADDRQGILVSGGGGPASLPLYRAALDAASRLPGRPWRILVGGGVPEAEFAALRAGAPAHASVERARPDFRALLAQAALAVSQAGYNTVMDLVAARTPAILVPFEAGRETEQRQRAELLARHGLASVLPEAELSGEALARLAGVMAEARPPAFALDRNGLAATVKLIESMAAGR